MNYCPNCGRRFSDWFIWDGLRHCYPCWSISEYHRYTYLENGNKLNTWTNEQTKAGKNYRQTKRMRF